MSLQIPEYTFSPIGRVWFILKGNRSRTIQSTTRLVDKIEFPTEQARLAEAERKLDRFLKSCPQALKDFPERP